MRRSCHTMTIAICTLPKMLLRSSLTRLSSSLRFCSSSLTVVSSSLLDWISSFEVSSSSLMLWRLFVRGLHFLVRRLQLLVRGLLLLDHRLQIVASSGELLREVHDLLVFLVLLLACARGRRSSRREDFAPGARAGATASSKDPETAVARRRPADGHDSETDLVITAVRLHSYTSLAYDAVRLPGALEKRAQRDEQTFPRHLQHVETGLARSRCQVHPGLAAKLQHVELGIDQHAGGHVARGQDAIGFALQIGLRVAYDLAQQLAAAIADWARVRREREALIQAQGDRLLRVDLVLRSSGSNSSRFEPMVSEGPRNRNRRASARNEGSA